MEKKQETPESVAQEGLEPSDPQLPEQPSAKSNFVLLKDSLFGHMLVEEAAASAAMARRRAMMLVDVLVERHGMRLKRRWVLTSAMLSFCYLRYALPMLSHWGSRYIERSMDASTFAELLGGPYAQVSFGILVLVTLMYLSMLHWSWRIMETRLPVSHIIFETLVVHNMTQALLNSYLFIRLLLEASALGFPYPWGNQFNYTKEGHRLGYFIWFQYHMCQLELFDTLFVIMRKKFRKVTALHVWLRLLNMWGWFFACRYACGGDAYFPAAANALTRAVVYAFYSLSLLSQRGVPLFRKARVTGLQILFLLVCTVHALYCFYAFWDMQIPKMLLGLYFAVMLNGLVLYTDFHFQTEGKSKVHAETNSDRKVSFAFDSSGWLYCYHFGVATWLREHLLPEGIGPEDAGTERYPADLTFSGSSGGALVAAALSTGLDPAQVFEQVIAKHPECRGNPFRMLPAMEDVLHQMLPANACRSCTGRIRVVLTRMWWRYPFFTAEVVNQFRTNQDVFHALRATCHVPFIAGLLPYRYDGNLYFDGLLWPQLLVPWKGARNDFRVKVSACSMPTSDIRPPIMPPWWVLFPPSPDALRGLFWMGYRDAGHWFARSPRGAFECLSCCRRPDSPGSEFVDPAASPSSAPPQTPPSGRLQHRSLSTSSVLETPPSGRLRRRSFSSRSVTTSGSLDLTAETDTAAPKEDRSATWSAARNLLLRSPRDTILPETDKFTGRQPSKLIAACEAAMERDRRRMALAAAVVCVVGVAGLPFKGF